MAIDLTPEQLEKLVLSSLATAEDVLWAQKAGIRRETFLDALEHGTHSSAWDYLVERVSQTGYVPSVVDFATVGFDVMEGATDYKRFVEQLVKEDATRRAKATLYRLAGNLEKAPFPTIDLLVAELQAIRQANQTHAVFFDGDALARYDEACRRSEKSAKGEAIGIPTGLPLFDHEGGDWQKGEMVAVMGMPESGKSTLIVYFCAIAWAAGQRVLFISPENLSEDIHLRADPMVAHQWGIQLSNRALRTGRNLDLEVYHQFTSSIEKERRWKTVDSGEQGLFTVNDIRREVQEFKPDILAIDGVHLLHGQGETWQNIFHAGKVLKGLSQELGMVTFVACQADKHTMKSADTNPDMGNVAYGKAIMEDANRVLSLAQDRGGMLQRSLVVKKWRDGPHSDKKFFLRFDVDSGDIRQMTEKVTEKTGTVDQVDFE